MRMNEIRCAAQRVLWHVPLHPSGANMKRLIALLLAAFFAGCQRAQLAEAQKRSAELQQQVAQLTSKLKVLEAKNVEIEEENTKLKETDQVRFQRAADLETAGNISDAAQAFAEVATKF